VSRYFLSGKSYQSRLAGESVIIKIMRQKKVGRRRNCSIYGTASANRCTRIRCVCVCVCVCPRRAAHRILASRISMGGERTNALASSEGCTHPVTQCRDPPLETPKPSHVCDWFVRLPLGFSFPTLGTRLSLPLSLSLSSSFSFSLSSKCYYRCRLWKRLDEAVKSLRESTKNFYETLASGSRLVRE